MATPRRPAAESTSSCIRVRFAPARKAQSPAATRSGSERLRKIDPGALERRYRDTAEMGDVLDRKAPAPPADLGPDRPGPPLRRRRLAAEDDVDTRVDAFGQPQTVQQRGRRSSNDARLGQDRQDGEHTSHEGVDGRGWAPHPAGHANELGHRGESAVAAASLGRSALFCGQTPPLSTLRRGRRVATYRPTGDVKVADRGGSRHSPEQVAGSCRESGREHPRFVGRSPS